MEYYYKCWTPTKLGVEDTMFIYKEDSAKFKLLPSMKNFAKKIYILGDIQ
jgi:hypothetical protein